MSDSFNILTVCTGNVCRSPLAEYLLKERLQGVGGDDVTINVASAGTHALVGKLIDEETRVIAASHGGANVSKHRARQLTSAMLEDADLILAMTRDHRREIVELNPRVVRRVFTARELARLAQVPQSELAAAGDAAASPQTTAARLGRAVQRVTMGRSRFATFRDPSEDDVMDPYGRRRRVHQASAAQLVPAVDSIAEFLRNAAKEVT